MRLKGNDQAPHEFVEDIFIAQSAFLYVFPKPRTHRKLEKRQNTKADDNVGDICLSDREQSFALGKDLDMHSGDLIIDIAYPQAIFLFDFFPGHVEVSSLVRVVKYPGEGLDIECP